MAITGQREDLYTVTLEVLDPETGAVVGADKGKPGIVCDKMTGGNATGKDLKYRPANGLENQLSLGGPKMVNNITLSRIYGPEVSNVLSKLLSVVGRASVNVHKQPLDENGIAKGPTLTYTGKLLDVNPPPTDSEADKAAVCEFIVSPESTINVS